MIAELESQRGRKLSEEELDQIWSDFRQDEAALNAALEAERQRLQEQIHNSLAARALQRKRNFKTVVGEDEAHRQVSQEWLRSIG